MIKGALILEINLKKIEEKIQDPDSEEETFEENFSVANWKLTDSYLETDVEKPNLDSIKSMIKRLELEIFSDILNVRKPPFKFSFQILPHSTEMHKSYLLYMLDASESLEILSIEPCVSLEELSTRLKKRTKIKEGLKQLVAQKNNLLRKLEDISILQKQIGAKANELIDKGDYTQAQDLMKIAKTVPDKFMAAIMNAKVAFRSNKFRQAEKYLLNAYDFAGKLEDKLLQAYIKLRIEKVQQIPAYYKVLKKNLKVIKSNFSKYPKYLKYFENIPLIDEAMDVLDELENDDEITSMLDLEELLEEAEEIAVELYDIDRKIETILKKLSI